MDIVSSLALWRVGPYGPHVLALVMAVGTVAYIIYRLRPRLLTALVLVVFGWQLEEALFAYFLFGVRQAQGYPGLSFIWSYLVGGSIPLTFAAIAAGIYLLRGKLRFSPMWAFFVAVAALWAIAGAPTSLDTGTGPAWFPSSLSVSAMEETWVATFCMAFYDSFRYGP